MAAAQINFTYLNEQWNSGLVTFFVFVGGWGGGGFSLSSTRHNLFGEAGRQNRLNNSSWPDVIALLPPCFCRVHYWDGGWREKKFSPLWCGDFNRFQAVRLAQLPTVALHLFTTSPLKSCNVKCHVVYSTSTINPLRFFSYSLFFRPWTMCEEGKAQSSVRSETLLL